MKRLVPIAATLLLVACTDPSADSAFRVNVRLGEHLKSTCFKVTLQAKDVDEQSGPVRLGAQQLYEVGVLRGQRPEQVALGLLGYADVDCRTVTDPAEGAALTRHTFVAGRVVDVDLKLERITPGSETGHCANGVDDDDDGQKDCADPDCADAACSSGNACITGETCRFGVCMGGQQVQCRAPPDNCHEAVGACVPANDAGCQYEQRPSGAPCQDGDACTTNDRCTGDARCEGTPRECTGGTGCFEAQGTCNPDGGTCDFAVRVGQPCQDADDCTHDEFCQANATCTGPSYPMVSTACAQAENACSPDGGRLMTPRAEGTACDAGVCNGLGGCVPLLPYAPSNFQPAQVPLPPPGGVTLGCGVTVIDTSDAGRPTLTNWCPGQPEFGYRTLAQDGGPDLVMLSFSSLRVVADAGLTIQGSKPVVLVSLGNVDIEGAVVMGAGGGGCPPPGEGSNGGVDASRGGGGGGGFATAGGAGAAGSTVLLGTRGSAGGAGAANGTPALVPLRPGCGGGRGGGNTLAVGAGGGALQISAGGLINILGSLSAPGGGGAGGSAWTLSGIGANGGGSGGALVLEGLAVQVNGQGAVTANGGAGGEGGTGFETGLDGMAGGRTSATAAPGGNSGLLYTGGHGGNGGAGTSAPTAGAEGTILSATGGGGGGGSAGRIRFNAPRVCQTPQAVVSPPATLGVPDAGCP